jgi:membrane protease YdiL (CAAX protease family)
MGVLAWIVAPLLRDQLEGDDPFAQALLIVITAGLIWQFVLVLILVRLELGTLRWPRVREALWLRTPRDPKTGRAGGRVWLWALLFIFLIALWQLVPAIPGPSPRDFTEFLSEDRGKDFFRGAWGWFAVVVVFSVFNTVLGEELLFRGLLLPRMPGRLRPQSQASEWGAARALPPAPTVVDPQVARERNALRLSHATFPERLDGDHRALAAKRLRDRLRPRGRTRLRLGRWPPPVRPKGSPARAARYLDALVSLGLRKQKSRLRGSLAEPSGGAGVGFRAT